MHRRKCRTATVGTTFFEIRPPYEIVHLGRRLKTQRALQVNQRFPDLALADQDSPESIVRGERIPSDLQGLGQMTFR